MPCRLDLIRVSASIGSLRSIRYEHMVRHARVLCTHRTTSTDAVARRTRAYIISGQGFEKNPDGSTSEDATPATVARSRIIPVVRHRPTRGERLQVNSIHQPLEDLPVIPLCVAFF